MGTNGILRTAGIVGLLGGLGVGFATPVGAATSRAAAATSSCTGTQAAPGVLAGTYASGAVITGYCVVDGGPAVVEGNLTVAPGATLDATFASDDVSGSGPSSLSVSGNLKVDRGATLAMGCEPLRMPCADDPTGTLTGSDRVGGNLVGARALGLVVHASTVVGNLTESGGGGGPSCAPPPTGYFAQIGNPVYSDVEDDTVGGNLRVVRLQTCWLGLLRDTVQGNLTDRANAFTDPDANEALANTVRGNLACSGNTPAVHYGDSGGSPNLVHGRASGECSFTASTSQPIAVKS